MKNSCASISNLIERYFDREATDEERSLVEAHLLGCSTCQRTVSQIEKIRELTGVPAEEIAREEDFDRVWIKVKREIQQEERHPLLETLRSHFNLSTFLQKKVWVPAFVAVMLLIFIAAPRFLKKSPSLPGEFGVEYLESETNNVMVYELEPSKVTVIWLFEGPETGSTAS